MDGVCAGRALYDEWNREAYGSAWVGAVSFSRIPKGNSAGGWEVVWQYRVMMTA